MATATKRAVAKSKKVKPIPEGYHTVTPYLYIQGAAQALDFYKRAFNAKVLVRMDGPGGKLGHAEIQIGDSCIMLADEHPEVGALSPQTVGGAPFSVHLYVENSDKTFAQAIAAGATEVRPLKDQFYGDRSGSVKDPFGFTWFVSTHVRDVSPEEMKRAMEQMQEK